VKRLEPSERKLLGVFVREALSRPGEDTIDTSKRNPKTVQALRSSGFILQDEDSLTKEAFLTYFEAFDEIECPHEVQRWIDRFAISEIHWRRPSGILETQIPQERGKAYPLLSTVFIGKKAGLATWFHELGHLLHQRIDKDRTAALAQIARTTYPVVSSDEVSDAIDPDTLQTTSLPEGVYLNINGQYCGLDHSGDSEDAMNDELWAILFTEHCKGCELPSDIQVLVGQIVAKLEVRTD